MYTLLWIAGVAVGVATLVRGLRRENRALAFAGLAIALFTLLLFSSLRFFGEWMWFQAVGYEERFWAAIAARWKASLLGAALLAIGTFAFTRTIVPTRRKATPLWVILGALLGGLWGARAWQALLLFSHRVSTGETEPFLGKDVGFYLFTLPWLDALHTLAWLYLFVCGLTVFFTSLVEGHKKELRVALPKLGDARATRPLLLVLAGLALLVGAGAWLSVYELLHSSGGTVAGPGWTDARVRKPALYGMAALAWLGVGGCTLYGLFAKEGRGSLGRFTHAVGAWAVLGIYWILALGLAPALVQRLAVEPNEITFERPYIANNIEFTRRGFGLDRIEARQFPANEVLSREILEGGRSLLSEVRLWDYRALAAVYRQFQEIRLYYAFHDVDIDRYHIGDRYRQVMVSPRELETANLPEQSRTFVNRRFKYTHGYGLTMATVSDFTPEGLPNLLIQDLPPRTAVPELAVEIPQIYYGELTRSPVVVNSSEQEFDYPSGDENVYLHYSGEGGVPLTSLWRRFVYGWMFDGSRLFFSSYPGPGSRLQFHRQVVERASLLAPFLEFDADPYVVLVDGRMHWILDAYTTSSRYPYSERFWGSDLPGAELGGEYEDWARQEVWAFFGQNYVRNSVKAVVDAFDGTVRFYAFDEEDPLLQAWSGAFPGLFLSADEMPRELREHVRYPADYLQVQGQVYAKYHMEDPEVFYNQEDLWVRATEKYYSRVQPVEPYYVMWQQPGEPEAEFVLMMPFTPKNRQVSIGWMAGMCDGENYGRLLAYKFPKEKHVLGPQQVETKIDQDPVLSGQLTLWDQRGSNVIRGNVLAIPIEDTLLYVEPIYLQAETAAYPELRLVAVMHGDRLGYGKDLTEALEALLGESLQAPLQTEEGVVAAEDLAASARAAYERYLTLTGEGKPAEAGRELERLGALLERLVE